VQDQRLIKAHTDLAGKPRGLALDLCCGTGQIGRALKKNGWDVRGLDLCSNMAGSSRKFFPVLEGAAEQLPFKTASFRLAVCRQTVQFLGIKDVFSEVSRVLSPGGIFIVSLTVPFSGADAGWLYEIHRFKQPLLLKFYTVESLSAELKKAGFVIKESRRLVVRESIDRWMARAPELSRRARQEVISMVENAPAEYRRLHHVEKIRGEVFEDWNWVVLKSVFRGR
jgi:ubiquinone/menaquinone biosynthesis C-methylase UbiE